MKKFIVMLLAMVLSLTLAGCAESEYQVDGTFTAYEVSLHYDGTPQVTYVSVTIEKGKIVSYDIDVRQGSAEDSDTEGEYDYAWNEETKKELGDEYGMEGVGQAYELVDGAWVAVEDGKSTYEWYEQAEMVEAYWLENGVDAMETIDGRISNVSGVTVKDAYSALALEALENAKAGKVQAFLCEGGYNIDFVFASMTIDEDGNVANLVLDVLQGNASGEAFAWDEETKQEKGDEYGMVAVGAEYEWYEQANMLTDYIVVNGWNADLTSIDGSGVSLDGTTVVEGLSGVTVTTDSYLEVLEDLFGLVE